MTFLHPMLLAAGMAGVAVPILIHLLLRQRRKPVMWGAMRFLLEAYRKQRRRLKVEQWLLLAARCLLLALLAMALARPLLEGSNILAGPGGRTVYILLDNGLASALRAGDDESSAALVRLKEEALGLVSSLGAADRVGLVLMGAPAEPLVVPASPDASAVRRLIEEASSTDAATDFAGAMEAVRAAASAEDESRSLTIAIFSDFLVGSADVSRPLPPGLAERGNVRIIASKPRESALSAGNVQIVSVEPLRPVVLTGSGGESGAASREQVRVGLRRTGPLVGEASVSTLRLRIVGGADGTSSGAASQTAVRWAPGQSETTISVQVDPLSGDGAEVGSAAGALSVIVAEIDRDALPGDNTLRRPVSVRESLRVGVVARRRFGGAFSAERLSPADWVRLALRPTVSTPIDLVDIEPASLDVATLASVDVVFAPEPDLVREEDWSKLRRFVDAGGLLVVSPASEASVHLWTDSMVREMGLAWRLAREPRNIEEGMGLDDRAIEGAEAVAGGSVLSLLTGELSNLVKPVSVRRMLGAEEVGRQTEVLLKLADGSPWIIADHPGTDEEGDEVESGAVREEAGRGLVVYLASAPALSWTDLPAKPLMVPLVQELARQGFGRAAGSWQSVAGRALVTPARTASVQSVGEGESTVLEVVESGSVLAGATVKPVRSAGVWRAVDEAGRTRGLLAVNADTEAGRTSAQDPGAVMSWLRAAASAPGDEDGADRIAWLDAGEAATALAASEVESPLSLPLLIGVLFVAVMELVMARYFSHAFGA